MSLSLLTDRTLALREHEDVVAVLLTGKCRFVLAKYNVTLKEYYCVCYMNCPWRPHTEEEAAYWIKLFEMIADKAYIRKRVLGIVYPVILILGITGICIYFDLLI